MGFGNNEQSSCSLVKLNDKLQMLMFQHFVYCYCHDRPGIYSFLIVLKEADKVG